MPLMLSTTDPGFEAAFSALLAMKREDAPDVDAAVAAIIAEVRALGDAALIELTARFDRLEAYLNDVQAKQGKGKRHGGKS